MCFFSHIRNDPKKHINKFLPPTQSRDNPANLFMFMFYYYYYFFFFSFWPPPIHVEHPTPPEDNRTQRFFGFMLLFLAHFREEKTNKQKTHKHFSDGPCGTIVPGTNPTRQTGQTGQNGNFTVELNRERPVCPRDGSHFVPRRGPICPRDGSCLSRTPACLIEFFRGRPRWGDNLTALFQVFQTLLPKRQKYPFLP